MGDTRDNRGIAETKHSLKYRYYNNYLFYTKNVEIRYFPWRLIKSVNVGKPGVE